jgi:hypothetical protein
MKVHLSSYNTGGASLAEACPGRVSSAFYAVSIFFLIGAHTWLCPQQLWQFCLCCLLDHDNWVSELPSLPRNSGGASLLLKEP